MGPISLDEAKAINVVANHGLSQTEVEDRFKQFGGSARYYLFNEVNISQQKVDGAFTACQSLQ